jgi:serine/threonine-protein phosphatase PGAM5
MQRRIHLSCFLLVAFLAAATAPAAEAPKPGEGIRWIYLVRHGMYDNVEGADDRVGNALNALGHEQARLTGDRLAALPVHIDLLVSSNYTRARETADDIGKVLGMPAGRDTLLHECTPKAARADYMKNHTESDIALCESNLQAAWSKYVRPSPDADAHDVLVCHGNVIRWFVCKALGVDTQRWSTMAIGNGSITAIGVRSDGTTFLATFSDTGHLPAPRQTWTGRGAGWSPKP